MKSKGKNTIGKVFDSILEGIISAAVLMIVLVVLLQITFRLFKKPIPWAEEVARFTYVWLVFTGTAIAVKYNKHTSVDSLVKMMPKGILPYIEILKDVLMAVLMGVFLFCGIQLMRKGGMRISPALRLRYKWVYLGIPVGSGFTIVYIMRNIIEKISELREKTMENKQ